MDQDFNQFDPLNQGDQPQKPPLFARLGVPQIDSTQPSALDFSTPDMDAQEKQIWDRIINRTPRVRAKEIEAEMWKERYGLNPKSGKWRKVLAGVGELGRAMSGGKEYESIKDKARSEAYKEYQTEVGPLQRELGVLSNTRTNLAKLRSGDAQKQRQLDIQEAAQYLKMATSQQDMQQKMEMIGPRKLKMLAEAGVLDQRERLIAQQVLEKSLTNEALTASGGNKLTGKAANATGLERMSDLNPTQGRRTLDFLNTMDQIGAAAKGVPTPQVFNTKRTQLITDNSGNAHPVEVPVENLRMIPGQPDPNRGQKAINALFGGQEPPSPPRVTTEGQVLTEKAPPKAQFQIQFGKYQAVPQDKVSKGYKRILKRDMGLSDEELANFKSPRYNREIYENVAKVDQPTQAVRQYRQSMNSLTSKALDEFAAGKDENISGLFNNLSNSWNSAFGAVDPSALSIRVDSTEAIANKIKSISGLTVSDKERKFLMSGLPDIAWDAPRTFLMKTLKLKVLLDMHDIQQKLKITPEEMEQVYSTPAGKRIFDSFDDTMKALEQVRTLARNGPNAKNAAGKKAYQIDGVVYGNLKEAESGIKDAISAKSQRELLRDALQQAGINDVVPPRKKGI